MSDAQRLSQHPQLHRSMVLAARATELVRERGASDDARRKRDKTPVTIADYASQVILLQTLREIAPEDRIYAEEEDSFDDATAEKVRSIVEEVTGGSFSTGEMRETLRYRGDPDSDRASWFVDPVDGTKGFLRGLYYCIAVARIQHGAPDVGLLAVPGNAQTLPGVTGQLFGADRGESAWRRPLSLEAADPEQLVRTPRYSMQEKKLAIIASRAHDTVDLPPAVEEQQWEVELVSMDSQAKYAALAAGVADIYPRKVSRWIGPFLVWDHAAGALIVEQSGGLVTDLAGAPLDWSQGQRLKSNRGIFAAAEPAYHEHFQSIFAEHGL